MNMNKSENDIDLKWTCIIRWSEKKVYFGQLMQKCVFSGGKRKWTMMTMQRTNWDYCESIIQRTKHKPRS